MSVSRDTHTVVKGTVSVASRCFEAFDSRFPVGGGTVARRKTSWVDDVLEHEDLVLVHSATVSTDPHGNPGAWDVEVQERRVTEAAMVAHPFIRGRKIPGGIAYVATHLVVQVVVPAAMDAEGGVQEEYSLVDVETLCRQKTFCEDGTPEVDILAYDELYDLPADEAAAEYRAHIEALRWLQCVPTLVRQPSGGEHLV